jgi:hypothetical protein
MPLTTVVTKLEVVAIVAVAVTPRSGAAILIVGKVLYKALFVPIVILVTDPPVSVTVTVGAVPLRRVPLIVTFGVVA